MDLKKAPALRWYFSIFEFVASKRLKNNDIDPREVHSTLVIVLTTGLLMWAYAFLAHFTISSPVPGYVGFTCALVHLFSPALYRVTNKSYSVANVLLMAGLVHQGTFTYYTGGFMSNILIWYGILPMLGGVICGRKGVLTWLVLTLLVAISYFLLHLSGWKFPHLITDTGLMWSHGLLVFGWIFLSSSIVIVYSGLRQNTEKVLDEQTKKIDELFRVLFHDLANPLGRISIGLSIARREMGDRPNRGMEIASSASESMLEITQNIRKMYAVSKGKTPVDLIPVSLNSSIDYILRIYQEELQRKHIHVDYDFEANHHLQVLVEPVSFNNQVLGNIISNAIKFSSPEGKITVSARKDRSGPVQIEVRDHGIGIPKELVSQLFDLRKKTSRPGTQGEVGTGFGMHIMKSFVEMYGGEVVIDSEEGTGTSVRLLLKGPS